MALADKKSNPIHDKDGAAKGKLKDEFDAGHLTKIASNPDEEPEFAGVIYQIGLVQEDVDELRRHVVADVVGSQGPKGDTGDAGADGSNGSNGSTGATGSTGAAGAAGRDGTNGTTPTMTSLSGSSLPTRAPARGSGLLWNDRGTVKIG